jgi:hypothetical protein
MKIDPEVTILMVEYENEMLVNLNMELTLKLNPAIAAQIKFVVVNNSNSPELETLIGDTGPEILDGADRVLCGNHASYHHAAALEKALEHVNTRFLLIIDPDFFVLSRNWLTKLLTAMSARDLGCIASTWHPRWFWQPRYVASVHFMLLDRQRIILEDVGLRPDQHHRRKLKKFKGLPWFVKQRLLRGTSRDTGWRLVQHLQEREQEVGLLTPVFESRPYFRRKTLFLDRILPDRISITPHRRQYYSTRSFLRADHRELYELGWEEFVWQGEPFAIHMRQVGRRLDGTRKDIDATMLSRALGLLEETVSASPDGAPRGAGAELMALQENPRS